MTVLKEFENKVCLVTGNTGFKGAWLSSVLLHAGATVVGFSDRIFPEPAIFGAIRLDNLIDQRLGDVADFESINAVIQEVEPDFIFHLAAEALVGECFKNPLVAFQTNALGTVSILECLRLYQGLKPITSVFITSDKVYTNVEQVWGYKETDSIWGLDPYSASKGIAEHAIESYWDSFFKHKSAINVGVGRAGNVIGGGDWSHNRIIPDIFRSILNGKSLEIRSPKSTRPWQHVLEPISGYLRLAIALRNGSNRSLRRYNFGPKSDDVKTVEDVVLEICGIPNMQVNYAFNPESNSYHEAGLLKLEIDLARKELSWQPSLNFSDSIRLTVDWYLKWMDNEDSQKANKSQAILEFTTKQISEFKGFYT